MRMSSGNFLMYSCHLEDIYIFNCIPRERLQTGIAIFYARLAFLQGSETRPWKLLLRVVDIFLDISGLGCIP